MIDKSNVRDLFDYDSHTGLLTWRAGGRRAGSVRDRGYRVVKHEGRNYREHRVIWLWMTGEWPVDQIDHDNRVRDDNRWENLKSASQVDNQRNRTIQRNNTSGVPGVVWHPRDRRWHARIKSDGRYVYLGSYVSKEDAIAARKAAELVYEFHPEYGAPKDLSCMS